MAMAAVGWRVLFVSVLLAACTSRHLSDVAPEPPGDHCPQGGVVIRTGNDDNGNGELGADEVDSTEYICNGDAGGTGGDGGNGTDGKTVLADTQAEPPGANCPLGGTRVRTGLDSNNDGVLEDAEVLRVIFVCKPADGTPTLVTVRSEPPGANCALGGSAIESGLDGNGNGVLDPPEIASTTYVCIGTVPNSEVIVGDFVLRTSFDAALLVGTKRITGSLVVQPVPGFTDVVIPTLETVDGAIQIPQSGLVSLEAPVLVSAASLSIADVNDLATVSLPALSTTGSITIARTSTSSAFTLPSLVTASGDVSFVQFDVLGAITFPSLTSVGGGLTIDSSSVTDLGAPGLVSIGGSVQLTNLTSLATIDLHALATVSGDLTLGDCPLVTSVALGALTTVRGFVAQRLLSLPPANIHLGAITDLPDRLELTGLPWPDVSVFSSLGHAGFVAIFAMTASNLDLPSLQSADSIQLSGNPNVTHVDGFASLQSASISIVNEDGLVGIGGFANLLTSSGVAITGNPHLVTITGFGRLSAVTKIDVQSNAALTDLNAFGALTGQASFSVDLNPALLHVHGPDGVTFSPDLELTNNPHLSSIDGFAGLTGVGTLVLDDGQLADIGTFENVTTATTIRVSSGLLHGLSLPLLRHVQTLDISAPLDNVDGLAALETVTLLSFVDPVFTDLRLPALSAAATVTVRFASQVTTIELPAMVTIENMSLDAPLLGLLSMPLLASITGGDSAFFGFNTPELPRCQITDLFAQAGYTGMVPASLAPCEVQ